MAYEAHVEGAPSEDVLLRLIEEAKEAGADRIEIETTHEDGDAWIRAGFTETARVLEAPISGLEAHVGNQKEPSFGSIHVQTDDVDAVVRAVRQFVPRLPGGSQGSVVLSPRDGWTSVVPTGLILSIVAVLLLAVSGWLGGALVYKQGVGTPR